MKKPKRSGVSARSTIGCRPLKISAAPSVRNKLSWNPHRYLVAAARRVWRWCPEKKIAAAVCAVGSTKRRCSTCNEVFPKKLVHMDHIIPVGKQPREWEEYPEFYRRLFCAASNIQGLCRPCHKSKTNVDVKEMRKNG
jgi:5-methylcytosine-specific restriction endonuclease McrA